MTALAETEPVPLRVDEDGVIRVGGTRVTLDTVIAEYQKGSTPEQIAQDFSVLQPADVYAVIAYFLHHREEVEEYLEQQRRLGDELQREIEERFPREGMRERLEGRLRSSR